MRKYSIVFTTALVLEIGSTFYISAVAEKSYLSMAFFAFIGPFLSLPFVGFMVEAKGWPARLRLALCSGLGYAVGALLAALGVAML